MEVADETALIEDLKCALPGCSADAVGYSNYCAPHRAAKAGGKKAAKKAAAKKAPAKRAAKKATAKKAAKKAPAKKVAKKAAKRAAKR